MDKNISVFFSAFFQVSWIMAEKDREDRDQLINTCPVHQEVI